MSEMALRHQLISELEKASPEVLKQLFEFLQYLKRAERITGKNGVRDKSIRHFIGCMPGKEGDAFAAAIEHEFNNIEGEW